MQEIRYIKNPNADKSTDHPEQQYFTDQLIDEILNYHKRIPQYCPTPLHQLRSLSEKLGLSSIYCKDESKRFGLKAFKALGASYAIGKIIARKLNIPIHEITFEMLKSKEIQSSLGIETFITTTDGNHGMGVAWTAQQMGQKAIVYMPKGSSEQRVKRIESVGAKVLVTDLNYDDTVKETARLAQQNNWILVQDTAWNGYTEIPGLIMNGYATMFEETFTQLKGNIPTHIFVQAGVGTLAASLQNYIIHRFPVNRPKVIVIEAENADCLYRSIVQGGDTSVTVEGTHDTIMAGLACGEPNMLAWDILRSHTDAFISCSDEITIRGMNRAANPVGDDPSFVSGESGAVTLGLVSTMLEDTRYRTLRDDLAIDNTSVILLFSTEGATDPVMYEEIVTGHPQ